MVSVRVEINVDIFTSKFESDCIIIFGKIEYKYSKNFDWLTLSGLYCTHAVHTHILFIHFIKKNDQN